jgi:tRNA A37 N6-isopentenylltransferase MiaA
MIIFLTGPTGVGKTDTSWSLLSLRDGMVFISRSLMTSRNRLS